MNDLELREYATKHLEHDARMFFGSLWAVADVDERPCCPNSVVVREALIVSFMIHARCFNDFLRGGLPTDNDVRKNRHDVVARHYAPGWDGSGFLTEQQDKDINGYIAHPAARRLDPREDMTRMDGIAIRAALALNRFCAVADPRFEKELAGLREATVLGTKDGAKLLPLK